jgi:hypothetical protein
MANPNQFPWVPQTEYARIPYGQFPGDVWEGDLFNERNSRGLIAAVTPVSQVTEVLIGANNPTDAVGVYIDGALIQVVAGGSAGATALLLEAAIEAVVLLANIVSTVTVDSATVTITFSDDQPHTVTEYSPDATTATVSEETAAVSQQRIRFGYGVAKSPTGVSINTTKIVKPSSIDDVFAGVIFRTPSSGIPDASVMALDPDYDVTYLPPGFAYSLGWRDMGVCVEYVGAAPAETDPVYWVVVGANAGKFAASDGGASQVTQGDVASNYVAPVAQVTRGDVVFNGTDQVGLNVDGLAPLAVASDTSDDITAAALMTAWNANPAYFAVATATINTAGAESYIILTFNDDLVHTVTAYSPATADITGITNTTAAVAEVADDVGVTVDSLPALFVASITDDDTTATALAAAWNASSQHSAVASAAADLAGATSLIVLTFLDDQTHTVVAYSPATADVTSITNTTAAVAITGKIMPNLSWGRPTNSGGEVPCAYLRLSNP